MNTTPYELLAGPLTLWVAPVGETFPDVDEVPAGNWSKVGSNGNLNYTDDALKVKHTKSITFWRSYGDGAPRKAFLKEEALMLSLTLADLTLEQYKHALNQNTVTSVAAGVGTAGYKKIGLSSGLVLVQRALLVRGPSPYGADFTAQYEVPITVETGSPEPTFKKDEPAALALEYAALLDPNAASADERFGRLICQTADAET